MFVCSLVPARGQSILKVVTDLTEVTFLQAFRRFAARRSLPRLVISDIASTYMSAAKEYLTLLREVHHTTGVTGQAVKMGDVVQIHDDSPRSQWKLTVIEDLRMMDT